MICRTLVCRNDDNQRLFTYKGQEKGYNIEVKLVEINNGMIVNEWKCSSLWEMGVNL
jgi:hypothetical protein